MNSAAHWFYSAWSAAIPRPPVKSVVGWCKDYVKLVGSALSESYNPDLTPWNAPPLECADNGTRKMTYIKPVQAGGSTVGECAICYWVSTQNGGDIQYNWQNDESADARWSKRVEKILLECKQVTTRMSADRFKWKKGLVIFPHCNLTMQGVNTPRNVASDSIRFQVNEEIHDADSGWAPGKLQQCYNRTTAFWNSIIFNISNAGYKGDQLHQAFEAGTQQHWEVKCPGCGQYHRMRTRWDEKQPQLGGLRYETFKSQNNEYLYGRIAETVRFQMPCGYSVRDDVSERRRLSLCGRYSEEANKDIGHPIKQAVNPERSFTLEAVSIDYIPWLSLIQEKHRALRALALGDAKYWWDYLRERECQFVDAEDRPIVQRIILSDRKKDRAGLPNRVARFGSLDYQKGTAALGELEHYWGVIQDVALEPSAITDTELAKALGVRVGETVTFIHFLTVFEGKLLTDEDAADVMTRHEVDPSCVVVDSGYAATHIYQFCVKHGFDCIKGEEQKDFPHGKDSNGNELGRKIFGKDSPVYLRYNGFPTWKNPVDEPMFWLYSRPSMMDRLAWLRSSPLVKYEVPADVSEDFIKQMDSWSLEPHKVPATNQTVMRWVQHKTADHLYFCAGYCALQAERKGLIGAQEMAGLVGMPEEKATPSVPQSAAR